MSGSLIPREDDDHGEHERGLTRRGGELSERRVRSLTEKTHDQLTGYVHEGETIDTPHNGFLGNEDVIDGEFTLKQHDEDDVIESGFSSAAQTRLANLDGDLKPGDLPFLRQEMKEVKPHIETAARIIGKLLAMQKKGIRNGSTPYGAKSDGERYEQLIDELKTSADGINEFVGHVTQYWGHLRSIASRLPHGMNLAEDLEALPHDFGSRISTIQSSLDLLGVRQHVDQLTLTVRFLDKVLPYSDVGMLLLEDDDLNRAVRDVAGNMDMSVPGVGNVDIFQYEIVKDGIEYARLAAERCAKSLSGTGLATNEDERSRATLATFYGEAAQDFGYCVEFDAALATLSGQQPVELIYAQDAAHAAVRKAMSGDADWKEAATLAISHMDLLRRHLRPRMQFLGKQMPSIQAVTPLTRVRDMFGSAWESISARFGL